MNKYGQQADLKRLKKLIGHLTVKIAVVLTLKLNSLLLFLGKFLVVKCEKKFLIYSTEEGKRISTIERREKNEICRWIKTELESETETESILILLFINLINFKIKFIVNFEFELKESEIILELKDEIFDVKTTTTTNAVFILQNKKLTKFKFPFDEISVLLISKLSKNLKTIFRILENVKSQFLKLLKFEDLIFTRLREEEEIIISLLLFGGSSSSSSSSSGSNGGDNTTSDNTNNANVTSDTLTPTSPVPTIKESDVLDWKSKLKKQHAEILVSVQELSIFIKSFSKNYPKFCFTEIDRFLSADLMELEDKSRLLQHDLAEFLIWIENLVIPDIHNQQQQPQIVKPFKPESRALELVKNLKRSNDFIIKRQADWCDSFDDFKLILDLEFKNIVSKINSVNLEPIDKLEISEINGFNRILSTDPLILLNQDGSEIFKNTSVIRLPNTYITHYFKNNQLCIICKGMIEVLFTDNSNEIITLSSNDDILIHDTTVYANPQSNQSSQLYLVPSHNPTKLIIK